MKKNTRTTRVYNPDLDEYEWREVETDKYVFDETDKIAIVREYHERGCPASEIVAKYHISSADCLVIAGRHITSVTTTTTSSRWHWSR